MGPFDRFAAWAAGQVARARFFVFCVLLILIWAPSFQWMPDRVPPRIDTWQLVINTATTIITFLLVALLHNDQQRFEAADNQRWGTLFRHLGIPDPVQDPSQRAD